MCQQVLSFCFIVCISQGLLSLPFKSYLSTSVVAEWLWHPDMWPTSEHSCRFQVNGADEQEQEEQQDRAQPWLKAQVCFHHHLPATPAFPNGKSEQEKHSEFVWSSQDAIEMFRFKFLLSRLNSGHYRHLLPGFVFFFRRFHQPASFAFILYLSPSLRQTLFYQRDWWPACFASFFAARLWTSFYRPTFLPQFWTNMV